MTTNFYQKKIAKIKELIKVKKYHKAYKIVEEEIKMPYIPAEYDEQFQSLKQKLNNHFKKNVINVTFSLDETIGMLYGNNKEQNLALVNLAKYNLRSVKMQLKKRLESWDDNLKKAFLYELLADQDISINIKINDKIINPKQISIFKNEETYKSFKKIETLTFKKPYLTEMAFNELRKYLLLNFPVFEFNGDNLGIMIFNIIDSMFDKNKNLSSEEEKIKVVLKLK